MERTKRTWQWVAYTWYSRIGRVRPVAPNGARFGSGVPHSSDPIPTAAADGHDNDSLHWQLDQASLPIRYCGDPRDIYLA